MQIRIDQPFGVDPFSSVRTNGKLDKEKLIDFFNAINRQP